MISASMLSRTGTGLLKTLPGTRHLNPDEAVKFRLKSAGRIPSPIRKNSQKAKALRSRMKSGGRAEVPESFFRGFRLGSPHSHIRREPMVSDILIKCKRVFRIFPLRKERITNTQPDPDQSHRSFPACAIFSSLCSSIRIVTRSGSMPRVETSVFVNSFAILRFWAVEKPFLIFSKTTGTKTPSV